MRKTVRYAARSHVGLRRENNEDNLFAGAVILPPDAGNRPFSLEGVADVPCVFAVSDGMGGEEDGETASLLAMETLRAHRERLCSAPPRRLNRAVQRYVEEANRAVQAGTAGQRSGATLALVVVNPAGAFCFSLGDSRIYCWQGDRLRQITQDHTVDAERQRRGLPSGPGVRPDHRITRCLGAGELQPAEGYPAITGDFRLLICSDGLTDMVDRRALGAALAQAPHPAQAADRLVRTALAGGGRDNITALVLDARGIGRLRFFAPQPANRPKFD